MAPSIPRKRTSPKPTSTSHKRGPPLDSAASGDVPSTAPPTNKRAAPVTKKAVAKDKPKPTLFDTLDAPKRGTTVAEAQAFLANLNGAGSDSDSDSDLSDVDSDDFEDVPVGPPAKRRKVEEAGDEDDEDEEMDFEDVDMTHKATHARHNNNDDDIEDVNISLNDDGTVAAEKGTAANRNVKKGPSKRDRQIRIRTHMMHVQALVFHNAVRNSWLNDKELHTILVQGLSDGVKKEVQRWRIDMGYEKPPEESRKARRAKRKMEKEKEKEKRSGRDWGIEADRLEAGSINMSRGDPIMRLLKVLVAYWKKRFTITAPGVRKQGYMPLRRLADDIKHWDKNRHDAEDHGERIEDVAQLRKLAKACEGSRDVGAQLFTALIRALGIEARMVASLQPVGFGWSKTEDAALKKPSSSKAAITKSTPLNTDSKSAITISDDDDEVDSSSVQEVARPVSKTKANSNSNKILTPQKPIRKTTRGTKPTITQDDSSDLSDAPSSSDESIMEVTPVSHAANKNKPVKKYDRDLAFPHYWTEVLSPATSTYIPVDSITLSTVATTPDLLSTFEPRGRASDTAKQVICYTLAYNPDATAKDVTVRYLKRHQLPGRTKGYRMPIEKVPILNKKGKVLRYEEQDWFSTVMLPFLRPQKRITEAEKKEDATDLLVFKPAAAGDAKAKFGEESLQWYKQSAEFVLERHLRREEALLPHAKQVRTFTSGKGDKQTTDPVYARKDVVACKTVESWHKEGRQILPGAQPLKMVPVRAVTLLRKREMEDVQRETGEKLKQGLYSRAQTEWIIPPPIGQDRRIPKNAFGNMDVYVPSMVPEGAVHVRLKGCAKLCRKMDLEHAEACVGFEFGKQRAVPVLFGVVVAEENEQIVRDAWRAEQELQRRKEDVKREALVLHLWRKFTMGLRIVERMKSEYKDRGGGKEEVNPFVNREKMQKKLSQSALDGDPDESMNDYTENGDDDGLDADEGGEGGGFFLPGEEEALLAGPAPLIEAKIEDEMDIDDYDALQGGGFILDDEEDKQPTLSSNANGVAKPMSLQSAHRSLAIKTEDDDDDEEEEDEEDEDDKPSRPTPRSRGRTSTATIVKAKKPLPRASATKPKSQPKARAKATVPAKRATKNKKVLVDSEDDDDQSDLTELSITSAEGIKDESDEDDAKPKLNTRSRNRNTSPKVVITPQLIKLGSVKSRYFNDRNASSSSSKLRKATTKAMKPDYENQDDDEDELDQEHEHHDDDGAADTDDDDTGNESETADAAARADPARARKSVVSGRGNKASADDNADSEAADEEQGDDSGFSSSSFGSTPPAPPPTHPSPPASDDDEDDEEEEVVKPRRTTARTRSKP